MRTVAVVGTAGGAGASTLVALAVAAARTRREGAPQLLGRTDGLLARAGVEGGGAVDPRTALLDAGVHSPSAAAELLTAEDAVLVVAAPDTPLGSDDVRRFVTEVLRAAGHEGPHDRLAVVRSGVYGRRRSVPPLWITPVELRVPYEPALARAGAVPGDLRGLSRRGRAAVTAWQTWCARMLHPVP